MNPSPRFLAICGAVRESIEIQFPRRLTCANTCALACVCAVRICQKRRVPAEIFGGHFVTGRFAGKPEFGNRDHLQAKDIPVVKRPHAWLRHRRNYVDITLTQFVKDAPRVAILPLDDARYEGYPEELLFVELAAPVCGWSEWERDQIIFRAEGILRSQREAARDMAAGEKE